MRDWTHLVMPWYYEDCGQKSGDYRGLSCSTKYISLKLQRVIVVFSELYAMA